MHVEHGDGLILGRRPGQVAAGRRRERAPRRGRLGADPVRRRERARAVSETRDLVLSIGRLYCDLVFRGLDALPALGEERFARDVAVVPGGGGFITAAHLAALGGRAGTARPDRHRPALGRDRAGAARQRRRSALAGIGGGRRPAADGRDGARAATAPFSRAAPARPGLRRWTQRLPIQRRAISTSPNSRRWRRSPIWSPQPSAPASASRSIRAGTMS